MRALPAKLDRRAMIGSPASGALLRIPTTIPMTIPTAASATEADR